MRKNIIKAIAGCAAFCFMAGMIIASGNNNVAAEDNYVCNYDFNDGFTADELYGNFATVTLEEGLNSTMDGGSGTDGNCIKISNRGKQDWWEKNALAYKLTKLEVGKKYTITFDIYHENGETADWPPVRACIVHTQDDWGQIGQPMAAPANDWERVTWDFDYTTALNYIYIEFAYPEATDNNENNAYTIKNTETYYIDNFSIKEYVAPTAAPPAATATPEPVVTPEPALPPAVDAGLDIGYEEVVGTILYSVTGKDTVAVKGFDDPKSKIVIPDTVVIEDYTYKVTSIDANAFKLETDVKSLTIGANVTTIGKSAFFKCSSLKKITIKSAAISSIGKKAFKGTHAKATVKVPKTKKAAYKKLLKKAGISKKAKIK